MSAAWSPQHLLEAGHAGHRPRRPLHRLPRGRPRGRGRSSRAHPGRRQVARTSSFDGVLHFAAFSQVGESVAKPEKYWDNNVGGTMALLAAMRDGGRAQAGLLLHRRHLRRTATRRPITETRADRADQPVRRHQARRRPHDHAARRRRTASPRSRCATSTSRARTASYGERHDPESHLIPLVLQVAQGRREAISVFGDDYPTPDGTCVRDYIHVADLAEAHLLGAATPPTPGRAPDLQPRQRQRLLRPRGHRDRPQGHRPPVPEVVAPAPRRRPGGPGRLRRPRPRAARLAARPAPDLAEIVADAWEFAQTARAASRRSRAGRDGFASCTGPRPRVSGRRPGRVNLIGEHTDYNDGFVMPLRAAAHRASRRSPAATTACCGCTRRTSPGGVVELRVDELSPGAPDRAAGPPTRRAWSGRCARRATRRPARTSTSTSTVPDRRRACPPPRPWRSSPRSP